MIPTSFIFTGIAVASSIGISLALFLLLRKRHVDTSFVHSIGRMSRKISANPELAATGWKEVQPTYVPAEPVDIVAHVEGKVNRNCLIVGQAGTGKSVLATLYFYELKKPFVVFSLKTFPSWGKEDFVELPNTTKIDMTQFLPSNIFTEPDRFASAYALALLSGLSLKGMMWQSVKTQVRNLITDDVKSWEELKKKAEREKKNRNSTFDTSVLNSISDSIEQFLRFGGKQQDLNIDWKNARTNYILAFGEFGDDNTALKIFYAEYLLRDVFSKQLGYLIAIDEAHLVLKEGSIIGLILRTGRVSTDLLIISQGLSDIERKHLQFGTVFMHRTINRDDIDAIPDEFTKDAVRQLRDRQFIDLTECYGGETIIYDMDIKGFFEHLEKIKSVEKEIDSNVYVPPITDRDTTSKLPVGMSAPVQVASPAKGGGNKLEKKIIKEKIMSLLENNAMNISPLNYALGIVRDDGSGKFFVKKCLDELVKEGKIRVMKYVIAKKDGKPKRFYYRNANSHTITPIHEAGVSDSRKEIEKITPVINEYDPHHGWDISTKYFEADFKTNLENDVKGLIEKIKVSQKTVIVICANYECLQRYRSALEVSEGIEGKWRCSCLDTLAEVASELMKGE